MKTKQNINSQNLKGIQHFYLRTKTGTPVGVVAVKRESLTDCRIAASMVTVNDTFTKKLGRDKARGKLNSTRKSVVINCVTPPSLSWVLNSSHLKMFQPNNYWTVLDVDKAEADFTSALKHA